MEMQGIFDKIFPFWSGSGNGMCLMMCAITVAVFSFLVGRAQGRGMFSIIKDAWAGLQSFFGFAQNPADSEVNEKMDVIAEAMLRQSEILSRIENKLS